MVKSKKYRVYLSKEQRNKLENITKRGKQSATIIKRANILLNLDENNGHVQSQEEIAKQLCTTTATIYNVSKQFAEEGLDATICRKIRETPPIQPKATGDIEAKIIALACSEPPKGRNRWTLRLLEEKVVELQIVDAISDNTIGRLLKKHHLSLT
jgi:transposase